MYAGGECVWVPDSYLGTGGVAEMQGVADGEIGVLKTTTVERLL